MSKTKETKEIILNKLKERKRTVTELSKELGLSKSTVSQHLSELENMGAVRGYGDEHFRSLKYYELIPQFDTSTVKARHIDDYKKALLPIAAIVGVAIIAALLLSPTRVQRPTGIVAPAFGIKPFINMSFINSTGFSVQNYSGDWLNGTREYKDFVLAPGYNGTITYTLSMKSVVTYNVIVNRYDNSTNPPTQTSNVIQVILSKFNVTNQIWFTGARSQLSGDGMNTTSVTTIPPIPRITTTAPQTTIPNPPTNVSQTVGSTQPPGITLKFAPKNETIFLNGSTVTVTASISIASNAPTGTYWLVFAPGLADSDAIAMLTVGTTPYNGPDTGFGASGPELGWTPP